MKIRHLLLPIIALLVFIPAFSAQAQDGTQPLDDEFIDALVMMAVNHDLLEGKNELPNLQGLKIYVNDYYDMRSLEVEPGDTAAQAKLQTLRQKNMDMLQKKIDQVKAPSQWLLDILDFFTEIRTITLWDPNPYVDPDEEIERNPDESDNLPDDVNSLMNAKVWTDFGATVNAFLNINTISAIPSMAPAINDSAGWSYNLPAISDSASLIPFSGDIDSSGDSTQPSPSDSAPPVNPPAAGSPGSGITEKRPVAFENNGDMDATIRPATYTPAGGGSAALPGGSTVVTASGNSSAYLELPLGTYTFCYEWDEGTDLDNDGYIDYFHATTSKFTLTENASQNMENAARVTFSAPGNSSSLGKCGQQVEAYTNLTPQEAAAVGAHHYQNTINKADGGSSTWTDKKDFQFTAEGVFFTISEDGYSPITAFYYRLSPNKYQHPSADTTLTFTDQGIVFVGSYNGGYTTTGIRTD